MKKIAIVSYTEHAAKIHKETLIEMFKDEADIDIVSLENHPISRKVSADTAILVAPELVNFALEVLSPNSKMVLAKYTLPKDVFEKIRKKSFSKSISVVCEDLKIAYIRKQLLVSLGIPEKSINLWCPGLKKEYLNTVIVLFGDVYIPYDMEDRDIIKVKGRLFSINTIIEVAVSLHKEELIGKDSFKRYFRNICTDYYRYENEFTLSLYHSLIGDENIKMGILAFAPDYTIFYSDSFIENITNKTSKELVGHKVYDIFGFYKNMFKIGEDIIKIKDKLIKYSNKTYVMNQSVLKLHNKTFGYIILSDYWEDVDKQNNLRKQAISKNYIAKYTFKDIVGNSSKIIQCKEVGRKMAKSNANVLITGPTGVGKELFAQSIHNESKRRNQPFIALNCGAIVDTLLESELFGYEKGAFTGANKEGKQGMFELAHRGTLFLDEIGELPLHLQSKLLRVLQEKEIVRVGGDRVIPIDVRIISATNKDLLEMVSDREFRMDLYYRLNVLPLSIPPLSERKEDIKLLFNMFLNDLGIDDYELSQLAEGYILSYNYPGNIRELQNCVEYIVSLGAKYVEVDDLPNYIIQNNQSAGIYKDVISLFKEDCSNDFINQKFKVLTAVNEINGLGLNAGRRSIRSYFNETNIMLSEYQIRRTLTELEKDDFITIGKGRAGIKITPVGKKVLKDYPSL